MNVTAYTDGGCRGNPGGIGGWGAILVNEGKGHALESTSPCTPTAST